jgi:hypothetical protein
MTFALPIPTTRNGRRVAANVGTLGAALALVGGPLALAASVPPPPTPALPLESSVGATGRPCSRTGSTGGPHGGHPSIPAVTAATHDKEGR